MLDAPTAARLARRLARAAARLVLLALMTGLLVGAAMTHRIDADVHALLASHLNALLGAGWMIGVAWSLPLLRLGPAGAARLVGLVTVANYANWLVTAAKAFLRVSGVDATGDARNDAVFGLLTVLVVLPSLAAAAAWAWALRGGDDPA